MEIWACTSYHVIFHWNVIIVSMPTVARLCFNFHSDHSDTVCYLWCGAFLCAKSYCSPLLCFIVSLLCYWLDCCLTESVQWCAWIYSGVPKSETFLFFLNLDINVSKVFVKCKPRLWCKWWNTDSTLFVILIMCRSSRVCRANVSSSVALIKTKEGHTKY